MFTLYESTNKLNDKVFIGISKDNRDYNINIDYLADVERLGEDLFTYKVLKSDIETLEECHTLKNEMIQYLRDNGTKYYNVVDNEDVYNNSSMYKTLSKKYSFVYVTTNDVNDYVYIGSHTTDNLDDGYIGSGRHFLDTVNEIGKEHFKRIILHFCDSHSFAKIIESTEIKEYGEMGINIYNRTAAGFGGNYGEEVNKKISEAQRLNWANNYDYMKDVIHTPESKVKRSVSAKEWIANNQEAHESRMNKINKNPEKIRKTAEKHLGMKRSDSTKKNISDKRLESLENATQEQRDNMTGKGSVYVTNIITYERKRVYVGYVLQEDEKFGLIRNPKVRNTPGRKLITNMKTWEVFEVFGPYELKENEAFGNQSKLKNKLKSS